MTKNKIADGLKRGRQERGYSVKEVSEFLINKGFKAGEKTIYSWESGNSQPTPDVFLTLCIYYGIDDVLENFGDDELNTNNTLDDEYLSFYEQLNQNEKISFYKILENIMKEKSLKVSDVAKLTNLAHSTIQSILTRKSKSVSLEVACKLSKGLNVPLEKLNGEDIAPEMVHNKFNNIGKKNLSPEDEAILSLYNQLDEGDKGEIRGEIKQMLKADKYSNQELKRMA